MLVRLVGDETTAIVLVARISAVTIGKNLADGDGSKSTVASKT